MMICSSFHNTASWIIFSSAADILVDRPRAVLHRAGRLSEDLHNAVELCGAVRGLGLTFDPSYYVNPATVDKVMDLIAPYTFHTHLRDSSVSDVQVQVGLGEVDFSMLVAVLRKVKYTRALSVELIPGRTDPEQRGLELRKLRMLIDSLL